ncbi:polysaccharide pyruvyl transferase family protein [Breznakia sp. OttesenSCG-928-G09]|nr:polysaccharide pyruvyl transferase family protein [Breznakia sp. OttesenSCG-928-G09]
MKKYKVLLCSLKHEKNIGDAIIADSTRYIIESVLKGKEYTIEEIDIAGKKDYSTRFSVKKSPIYYIRKFFYLGFYGFGRILRKSHFGNWLEDKSWFFSDERKIYNLYYESLIKSNDLMIFTGGGIIKFKYQNFYQYIDYITLKANKYHRQVIINAAGIEGYDDKDAKCRRLKKALNRECVKMITTRDDISLLERNYIVNKKIHTERVADSAVFISEATGISKNDKSEIIGIGLIRSKIFLDNDINFSEEDLLNFYVNLVNKLEQKNIKYKFFTNGMKIDYDFGIRVLEKLGREKDISEYIFPSPINSEELVKLISGFRAVIACRLHACIVSYSLDIPAIGIVWNNKLKMFGEIIGYSKRFRTIDQLDIDDIVEVLIASWDEGYDEAQKKNYRNTVYKSLEKYLLEDYQKWECNGNN